MAAVGLTSPVFAAICCWCWLILGSFLYCDSAHRLLHSWPHHADDACGWAAPPHCGHCSSLQSSRWEQCHWPCTVFSCDDKQLLVVFPTWSLAAGSTSCDAFMVTTCSGKVQVTQKSMVCSGDLSVLCCTGEWWQSLENSEHPGTSTSRRHSVKTPPSFSKLSSWQRQHPHF